MISQIAQKLAKEARAVLFHRLALSGGLLAGGQYCAASLNFLTNVLIARFLGPTDYGLVAMVIAYPTLLWSFVGGKSVSITTRYVATYRATGDFEKLKATVKLGVGLDFLVSVIAIILVSATAWWVSRHFYQEKGLEWLMIAYACSFPLVAFTGTSWAILSTWERFKWLAIFEVLHPLIKLGLIAGFLFATKLGAFGVVIGMAVAQASIGVLMLVSATSFLFTEVKGYWWKASLATITHLKNELVALFSWNYLLVTLNGLVAQVPIILLGRLRGPEEAGFYRLATSITTVGSYVETTLGRITYPALSTKLAQGEGESLKDWQKRWTLRAGLPAGAMLFLTIPLLPFLVPLVYGADYHHMVLGAQVMLVGTAISALFFWLNPFYYAQGKVRQWTMGYAIYGILIVGFGWFFIKQLGFIGLATLWSGTKIAFTLAMLFNLRRKYGRSV